MLSKNLQFLEIAVTSSSGLWFLKFCAHWKVLFLLQKVGRSDCCYNWYFGVPYLRTHCSPNSGNHQCLQRLPTVEWCSFVWATWPLSPRGRGVCQLPKTSVLQAVLHKQRQLVGGRYCARQVCLRSIHRLTVIHSRSQRLITDIIWKWFDFDNQDTQSDGREGVVRVWATSQRDVWVVIDDRR